MPQNSVTKRGICFMTLLDGISSLPIPQHEIAPLSVHNDDNNQEDQTCCIQTVTEYSTIVCCTELQNKAIRNNITNSRMWPTQMILDIRTVYICNF